MKGSEKGFYNSYFYHIYVEKDILENERVKKIISKFKNSKIIEIGHYKDIFCRGRQNFEMQKKSPAMILARKKDNLIYKGAKVCQSFGNEYFYYTSNIMNCFFDCEYCYLQGMYKSGNIVVFINTEDIFEEIEKILAKHSVYISISYDTDLLAMEGITGFIRLWSDFARNKKNLKVEIRTKSTNTAAIRDIKACDNIIFAWTVSPNEIVKKYEHLTKGLEERTEAVKKACEMGWKVRICFDPMIYCRDFERIYGHAINYALEKIEGKFIDGISIGVFRISREYMKNMRRQRKSAVTLFPYEIDNGVYNYGKEINKRMIEFAKKEVMKYIEEEKIFIWGEEE